MSRSALIAVLILAIVVILAVIYFDVFDLTYSTERAFSNIIHYEDIRRVSDELQQYLKEEEPEVRARAALAVGRIGDPSATPELFELLDDSSNAVAEAAAMALGISGDQRFAAELTDYAATKPASIQSLLVQSIGHLGDRSKPFLAKEISGYLDHIDHRTREQAAYALWRVGGYDEEYIEQLEKIVRTDAVRPVRVAALYALVHLGSVGSYRLYEEWLPDADPWVRSLAIKGLGLTRSDEFTGPVASGLNDRNNNVVAQSVAALGQIASERAIDYLIARLANETDQNIVVQIIETLGRLKAHQAKDYILDIVNDSVSVNVVGASLVYLAKTGYDGTIAMVDSLADLNDPYLNSKITEALTNIGGGSVKPRLANFFAEGTGPVRAAAYNALMKFDSANYDFYIDEALSDSDYVVVMQAVRDIGRYRLTNYLPQLATLMKMGQSAHPELKKTVAEAAAEFIPGKKDSLAEEVLNDCLLDTDYIVSMTAAELYREKLGVDQSAYVTGPPALVSPGKMKSFLGKYEQNPYAVIRTNRGDFGIELFIEIAPLTVYNFIELAEEGFYDGLIFYRVVPGKRIESGDPRGDGWGGPGYHIRSEYSYSPFLRGSVGMVSEGKDTEDSKFFVAQMPEPNLQARRTNFGLVKEGLEVIDSLVRGDSIVAITIFDRVPEEVRDNSK